jgi:hypothetical protein
MFGALLANTNNRIIIFVILAVAAYFAYKHIYLPRTKANAPVSGGALPKEPSVAAEAAVAPIGGESKED